MTASQRTRGMVGLAIPVALGCAVVAVFAVNVSRHLFVGDDAFISFRYAQNLVEGYGLVWNPGERVEGYTNFLWVLMMAAGLRLGVPPEVLSVWLGIASGLGLLAGLLGFSARRTGLSDPWIWLPLGLLACSRSFTAWCSGGLETMFFTLLVFAAMLSLLRERREQSQRPIVSSLLLAASTLTRPEGGLFAVVAGLALLTDVWAGRRRLRSVVGWAAPYLVIVGAHFLWRYDFYGFWWPNTFYAKVAGFWGEQAFHYLTLFLRDYHLAWFLPLVLLPLRSAGRADARMFAAVLVAYLAYLIYIGGDRFEYRFLVVVLPYFYWLAVEGLRAVASWGGGRPAARIAATAGAAALLATTVAGSASVPPSGERHGIATVEEIRYYGESRAAQGVQLRKLIDAGVLPDELILGVGGAGAIPYYTRWTTVDRRGLNDVEIAHTPLVERGGIAHEHDASFEYLERRRVAVFDLFNRLIHRDFASFRGFRHHYHDREVPVRAVELGNYYLVFASFVSDRELEEIFAPHPILR